MKNKPRIVRNRSNQKANLDSLVERFASFAVTGKQAAEAMSLVADVAQRVHWGGMLTGRQALKDNPIITINTRPETVEWLKTFEREPPGAVLDGKWLEEANEILMV